MDEHIKEFESLRTQLAEYETTERQGQRAAREERYQSQLLDSVQESVIATDLDGDVNYWGRGAQELYGYSADEVIGKCVTIIVDPLEKKSERGKTAAGRRDWILEGGVSTAPERWIEVLGFHNDFFGDRRAGKPGWLHRYR